MKFLIIRFSSIGDIILSSPVPRLLKQKFPESEIHFVTKKAFAGILAHNPYIDRIHILDRDLKSLKRELKAEHFDYVIDLHRNLRSMALKLSLSARSLTYSKEKFKKLMLVNFKLNLGMKSHVVDRYVNTLAGFGISNDGKGLDYFISPEDEVRLDLGKFAVMVVGASYFTKKLPTASQIEICRRIEAPVVLLGGKDEIPNAEEIATAAPNAVNLCGQYSLNQCASVIRQSECVISNDTGLMHMAAALSKPILATYGNSVTAFGFDPYNPHPRTRIFEVDIPCRPCSKFGTRKCPKNHFNCMNLIDSYVIANTANQIINEKA